MKIKTNFLLLLLICAASNLLAQNNYYDELSTKEVRTYYQKIKTQKAVNNVSELVNVKVTENKNVADPHEMLAPFAEEMIQDIVDKLGKEKDYEIMVVCLNSINGQPEREWATTLFNEWGIGDKETENGLLIIVINDVHRVEFITGQGMEIVLTDLESKKIQTNHMVPWFKENDYNTGIIRGVQAVDDLLRGKEVLYDTNPDDIVSANNTAPSFKDETLLSNNPYFIGYVVFCSIITLIYFIFLAIAFATKDLHKRYRTMKLWSLMIFGFLAPIPMAFLVWYTRKSINKWRNMERVGFETGELLHKLSEKEEDQYLSQGQIAEEVVSSVDYDVWVNVSGTEIVILPYKNWFTKFDKCGKCGYRTYIKLYDRVVRAATYTRGGEGEKKYQCKNCNHTKKFTYNISKKQRTNTRSGGGYYSGGGSFGGGSFGGGSSSGGGFSGGSFGGGSSRGGGAGSGW